MRFRIVVAATLIGAMASPAWGRPTRAHRGDLLHDHLDIATAVGAGAEGAALYAGLDLRVDAAWPDLRVGLGGRLEWMNGQLDRAAWRAARGPVSLLRYLEGVVHDDHRELAVAAGQLAPITIDGAVSGYQAGIDGERHVGVSVRVRSATGHGAVAIDDVLTPHVIGANVATMLGGGIEGGLSAALDPGLDATAMGTDLMTARDAQALVGGSLRLVRKAATSRAELGIGGTVSPWQDAAAIGTAQLAWQRREVAITVGGEVRAGAGLSLTTMGPLYLVERERLGSGMAGSDLRLAIGLGGVLWSSVRTARGWALLQVRTRPDVGTMMSLHGGAGNGPFAIGTWPAASTAIVAGSVEAQLRWNHRFESYLEAVRSYPISGSTMEASPQWALRVWLAMHVGS